MGKDLNGNKLPKGISQRKDKTYEARFTTKLGKRIGKTFARLPEAKTWLKRMQGEDNADPFNTTLTLEEWYEAWLQLKRGCVRKTTLTSYNSTKGKLTKEFLSMRLKDIKAMHVQALFNQLAETYSRTTLKTDKAVLSNVFQLAVDNELIGTNPVKRGVKIPKETKKKEFARQKAMTLEEQEALVNVIRKSDFCGRRIFELTLQTGMRSGEVTGLKWESIDFNKKIIRVKTQLTRVIKDGVPGKREFMESNPKSAAGQRDIPLTNEAIRILKEQPKEGIYVFLDEKGRPFTGYRLDGILKVLSSIAGIPYVSMHSLRHTFATRCAESGMQPKILQSILGHSNLQTTLGIYVHATSDEREKEMGKFEHFFSDGDDWRDAPKERIPKLQILA